MCDCVRFHPLLPPAIVARPKQLSNSTLTLSSLRRSKGISASASASDSGGHLRLEEQVPKTKEKELNRLELDLESEWEGHGGGEIELSSKVAAGGSDPWKGRSGRREIFRRSHSLAKQVAFVCQPQSRVMVLIEQESEGHLDERLPPPSAFHSATNADSDGFGTASDGDVDAGDAAGYSRARGEGEGVVAAEQSTSCQEDSVDNAMDEEANKKALDWADEAKLDGNQLFRDGQYEEALLKYELALQTAPDTPAAMEIRSACHSNRAVCFLKLGKYGETIKDCSNALELNPSYLKALVRRAEAHEKLDHFEEAIADCKKILELDPTNVQARKSLIRLETLAEERREKMKEEMIAKLKDMGNSLLGRFGMSTDNFKAVKDPNTGSYSISFQR